MENLSKKEIFLHIMDHPSNWIYRVLVKDNGFEIYRCNGEFNEIYDSMDLKDETGEGWEKVTDKDLLFDLYKYIIWNNVDFKLLFEYGERTLDNKQNG